MYIISFFGRCIHLNIYINDRQVNFIYTKMLFMCIVCGNLLGRSVVSVYVCGI